MAKRKRKPRPEAISLEEAMTELSGIVQELEAGQQPLAEALQSFERGMQLMQECDRQLNEAAGRVEILKGLSDDGEVVAPFDDQSTMQRQVDDPDSGSLF